MVKKKDGIIKQFDLEGIIKQFDLVIYPIDYVVVIGPLEEEVNRLYEVSEGNCTHIDSPISNGVELRVIEKKTGGICVMTWFRDVNSCTSSMIAHECNHAAMDIFEKLGAKVEYCNQEPYCYLAGALVRLATTTLYEIPGIQAPIIKSKNKKKRNG